MEWVDQTTSDAEIIGRRWLPLDFDPHRLSGIPATEEEKQASIMLAETAEELLRAHGWPYPAIMESGNGCYRLFRIDLPNDTETTDLLRRVPLGIASLLGTQEQESGPYATLDLTMFNAARIIRLPGTMNRKGDDTSTRPHRRLCSIRRWTNARLTWCLLTCYRPWPASSRAGPPTCPADDGDRRQQRARPAPAGRGPVAGRPAHRASDQGSTGRPRIPRPLSVRTTRRKRRIGGMAGG